MKDDLTTEVVADILRRMPERATGAQIVELFANILNTYNLNDEWFMIVMATTVMLDEIESAEEEYKQSTKH